MIIQWTSHLQTQEEKDHFERTIRNSKSVLERLQQLLDDRLHAIESIETSVEKYKQPGWDAIQAHYNGEKANLKYVKRIISIDPENK